ncbi:MAG TPA: prephenate dehydrogenase dimerization domain-containing protein, partial [Anaerolineales bacterium]
AEVEDEQVWTLAAAGFRDSTRLAASDVTMLLDILLTNRPAVLDGLARIQRALQKLAAFIEQNDRPHLQEQLTAIRAQRLELNTRTFQLTTVDRIK